MFVRAGWAAALALAACLMAGPSFAAGEAVNPITVYTQDRAELLPGGLADQLLARATAQGTIRVIVGLRLVMMREDVLAPSAAAAQVRELEAVQDRVIQRTLGGPPDERAVRFDFIPYMSLFVTAADLRKLLADPDVVDVEEDMPSRPTAFASSITIPHTDQVFAKGFNGSGYTVAIIDTGVDKTHPMLSGKVVSEACYSTNNAAKGQTSLCPGGATSSTAPGSGVNCPNLCDHGTHVASIAAGRTLTVGAQTVSGVARLGSIIAIQVFTRHTTLCSPSPSPCVLSYETDEIKGLQRVYQLRSSFKIIAVNMSLGAGKYAAACDAASPAMATAIKNLRAVSIATTVSSGNNGYDGYVGSPACISTAVAVGSTTSADQLSRSSNNSTLVKVLAPGDSIYAAIPGNKYAVKSGTSMAAPYVAGSIALLKSAQPTLTMASILTALQCGGRMITKRVNPDGGAALFLLPPRPRDDNLFALDFLKYRTTAVRSWDFNTAAQAFDWTPFRGNWAVSGGNYQTAAVGEHWAATSVASCDVPSILSASITHTDNPGVEPGWFIGLIVRAAIGYREGTVSGYWMTYTRCHARATGDCTGLPSDPRGNAEVYRLTNFNFDTNTGQMIRLCVKRTPIGGATAVRVVVSGSHYTYSVNGQPICSITDTTYSSGRTMIAARNNEDTSGALLVDAFSINFMSPTTATEYFDPTMDPTAFAPKQLTAR